MTISFDQSQDQIATLVKQFRTNFNLYHNPGYKEAHARQEFIDPMFMALDWDVHNTQHATPLYRQVVVEDSLDVEGKTKAPDYTFRMGREPVFFVEAKRPGIVLKSATDAAFQVRRYAWSAKLPLSILTDFEEFAVYDCLTRPTAQDKASSARANFYTFEEYADRWREIWDVFSHEAVLTGSFSQYAETTRGRRGTTPVDAEFLKEIERWRDALARNLALRNAALSIDELNDVVQRTIDRIIFLRMAEDRGSEPYERLKQLTAQPDIYAGLIDLSHKADAKYNSGLFDFSKKGDQLSPTLTLDDKILKPLILDLYYPNPYEFKYMPVEILGDVYEQFLGKVIRFTATHQAKVEEKPEVKKAGGVKYTPAYIVKFIVMVTVGKWIEAHVHPDDRIPLPLTFRLLDMACGSGSFLLGAFQYLLDYYLQWYIAHGPEKRPKAVRQIKGEWRLTIAEKKRILLAHIYGVDIDRQAVEVTKLSLLLKVLEGENEETLQPRLFDDNQAERALPNLDQNIKCGNSLIGPDYFTDQLQPDADEMKRVNPFDWQREFPAAMKAGGFDCIVGNPPWLMAGYYLESEIEHLRKAYRSAEGKFDLYYLFIELGMHLLNPDGYFGMIVPNKFFHTKAAKNLRGYLVEGKMVHDLIDFGYEKVFAGVTNYSCILLLRRSPSGVIHFMRVKRDLTIFQSYDVAWADMSADAWHFDQLRIRDVFTKMESVGVPLKDLISRFGTGVQSGADKILMVDTETVRNLRLEADLLRPVYRGRDVRRYRVSSNTKSLVFPYTDLENEFEILEEKALQKRYPRAFAHLTENRNKLSERIWFGKNATELAGRWYGMMYLDSSAAFTAPHLLTPSLSDRSNFALGNGTLFVTGTAGVTSLIPKDISENILYLLGVLNSRLLSFYVVHHSPVFQGGYYKFSAPYLKSLPIRRLDFTNAVDKAAHDRMVNLVNTMLQLHPRLVGAKSAHDRDLIQRQIDATDQQIDALVYQLYGLTAEEIKIVEGE